MQYIAIKGNRKALKGLGVGIGLSVFAQLTSNYIIMVYAVMIYNKMGTSLDSNISTYITAVAMIFGSIATTYLADKLGRKLTNLISISGSAIGLFLTSAYYYINLNYFSLPEWIPIASLSWVICSSSAGIYPLIQICTVEYLPKKVFINLYFDVPYFIDYFSNFRFKRLASQLSRL